MPWLQRYKRRQGCAGWVELESSLKRSAEGCGGPLVDKFDTMVGLFPLAQRLVSM